MDVEIISVGNEVVYGHTLNTNASYIAKRMQQIGMSPRYVTSVCDYAQDMKVALRNAIDRVGVVVITGGLGPTPDDLTKEIVCEVLNEPLEVVPEELEKVKNYFDKIGRKMTDNNIKQAAFPKKAQILPNDCGTAPGCILYTDNTSIVLLPGPPKEMKQMLDQYVLPILQQTSDQWIETLDIHCVGIGESELAMRIASFIGEYSWGSVATYVGHYEVIVRITARAKTKEAARQKVADQRSGIEECLENFVIGYNEDKLEEAVVRLLKERHYTIATAESCTGGLLAATLVNCGGVSQCLNEGVITYSNDAKIKYLGIEAAMLKSLGAVSEETAIAMAKGIREAAKADVGIATTGIAGPEGGTELKPVGLVYVAIDMKEGTVVYKFQLRGSRQEIRERTVKYALYELYKKLK